jgi:hypothetical protein
MTVKINSEEEGEDVGRNLLPKAPYWREERGNGAREGSIRGLEERR